LLKKGADPNIGDAKGDTALIIASRIGFDEAVDWMIRLGAKVDTANRQGETALIIAVQQRQPRVVERLLLAGANPDKGDHDAGRSGRDYAQRVVAVGDQQPGLTGQEAFFLQILGEGMRHRPEEAIAIVEIVGPLLVA